MAETDTDDWGATAERLAPAERMAAEALIVDVDGFEGPLDLLLDAVAHPEGRSASHISLLQLANQYLEALCAKQARALRIELAADYLVMAAWLAFLEIAPACCRLNPTEDGPSRRRPWPPIWRFNWNGYKPCARPPPA